MRPRSFNLASRRRIGLYFVLALSLGFGFVGLLVVLSASPASAMEVNAATRPILLIVNSSASNKFGAYLGEILRAEGLNAFDQVELSSLTAAQLSQHDLAILAQTPLSSAQATMLTTYVSSGGALLAMRPDCANQQSFRAEHKRWDAERWLSRDQERVQYTTAATPGLGLDLGHAANSWHG